MQSITPTSNMIRSLLRDRHTVALIDADADAMIVLLFCDLLSAWLMLHSDQPRYIG